MSGRPERLVGEPAPRSATDAPPARRRAITRLAVLLAWTAGAVDAIGYLALAHLFTAHMSGNTVALGASLGQGEAGEVLRRGVTIGLFAAGIALGTAIGEVAHARGQRHPTVAVFGAEAALLAAFLVLGDRWARSGDPQATDDWRFYGLVVLPTLAMGLQSATLRRIGPVHVRTTYISGVLTNLMEAVVHWLFWLGRRGASEPDPAGLASPSARTRVYASIWVAYLLGAILGGLGFARASFPALLLPIVGLAIAAALDLHHPHELAAEAERSAGARQPDEAPSS